MACPVFHTSLSLCGFFVSGPRTLEADDAVVHELQVSKAVGRLAPEP
jgi:hypothetical protein